MPDPDVKMEVISGFASGLTAPQDFTKEGFGTVKGAVVVSSAFGSDNRTQILFYDGTTQVHTTAWDQDGMATTVNFTGIWTSSALRYTIGFVTDVGRADTIAFIEDGIRLNWVVATAFPYPISVYLFGGADFQCKVGTVQSELAGVTVSGVGFEADLLWFLQNGILGAAEIGFNFPGYLLFPGLCQNQKPGLVQKCQSAFSLTGAANSKVAGATMTNRITQYVADPTELGRAQLVTDIGPDGFDFKTVGPSPPDPRMFTGWMAFNFGGWRTWMDFITTPDVLGPQAVDGPGWPAQFGLGVSSRMLEVDKDIFNNRASQHGVSGFTEEAAKSNNGFSKDNAPTSVCTSHIRDKALVVVRADGFDSSAEADFKAKEPLGAAFDWTKVDTAVLGAHHLIFLVEGPAKVPVVLTTTEGYIIKVQSDSRTVKHLATQPMIAKITEIRPRIAKVTAEDRDPNVISRVHE